MGLEAIAVGTVMAHMAQVDDRLGCLLFTTDITTRIQQQQKLQTFSYNKRKLTSQDGSSTSIKRFKPTASNKTCHYCSKFGHKISECLTRNHIQKLDSLSIRNPKLKTQLFVKSVMRRDT